ALPSFAQTHAVRGTVEDDRGNPVEGASVIVTEDVVDSVYTGVQVISSSQSRLDLTGEDGSYEVAGLPSGRYSVTTYMAGKRLATRRITVGNRDVRLDFELVVLESELEEIMVSEARGETFGITRLRPVDVSGFAIYDAKKTEVVVLDDITANLATNNSRQVYGRVAGLNIWESDGAGVQLGLGGRGLSPNRNSNFNTRQNGYDISADALGYPESYYTPPTQALDRIEIVRGAASLQYGTQFGGLVNFVFKDGPEDDPFELSSNQTLGSFGLISSFNSAGGSSRSIRYYGFHQYKRSEGWRPNSGLDQHTAYASLDFQATPRLTITPEITYMTYLSQQPGGLTDAQFEEDPRQSNRERNWFSVDWKLLALDADYRFSSRTTLNTRFFGLAAGRDALGNLGRIDRLDFGGNRDLLKDDFRNWGNETRVIHRYPLRSSLSVLLVGTRFYDGFTHRRQGEGPAGSDPEFTYLNPDRLEGSDFDLPSRNVSLFAENIFNLTPRLSVTPGVRLEYIRTGADGYYRNTVEDLAGNVLLDERIDEQRERERSFALFGVGMSYTAGSAVEVYANFSQNYRAITFNDVRVNIGSLEVDPDIADEHGFNADLGIRGTGAGMFAYDVSLFHLAYRDRIGTVLRTEPNPRFNNLVNRTFRYRTNIADARIYGVESFAELDLLRLLVDSNGPHRLSVFSNLSLISATYTRSDEPGIEGNEVELVPDLNLRGGITYGANGLDVSYQVSYVSEHFTDASNARRTPSAIEGIIPAYYVMDLSASYAFDRYRVDVGVNNLTDHHYFTRRATGYPGPGIIPADGRSVYVT
ncbi:MAG: TonB-dependent receptor, partial [Rhodothermales bacterium]